MSLTFDRLYNQDCLEGLAQVDDGAIDLIFADPPFNIGYDYDVYNDKLECDHYLEWCDKWLGQLARVLKPNGSFWLAIGDEYAADLKVLAQRHHKFVCRNWVIWYYTFGVHCKYKFARSHAHLIYFCKDPVQYKFNADAIRVPSARMLVYGDHRAVAKGRIPDDTWMLRPQDMPESFQPEEDTWYIPRVCGTFKERAGWHGCQMPEQLMGRIIRVSSDEGDVVLDPFGGSGATLAVAKKLGRQFIGFELSPEYAKRIEKRLSGIEVGDMLEGSPDPRVSAPNTAAGVRLEDREARKKKRIHHKQNGQSKLPGL